MYTLKGGAVGKRIYVCELMMYLGLCLFVALVHLFVVLGNLASSEGAAATESAFIFLLSVLAPVGVYLSYLLALRVWRALGPVGTVLLVLATVGGIFIILILGEFIRRVAYKELYTGPKPVPVAFGKELPAKPQTAALARESFLNRLKEVLGHKDHSPD